MIFAVVALSFCTQGIFDGFILCTDAKGNLVLELEWDGCQSYARDREVSQKYQCDSQATSFRCVDLSYIEEFPPLLPSHLQYSLPFQLVSHVFVLPVLDLNQTFSSPVRFIDNGPAPPHLNLNLLATVHLTV